MISLAGVIFAVVFTYFFVWLFTSAYKFSVKADCWNLMPEKTNRLIFFAAVFAGGWMCYWLLSQNRFVYYYDLGGYWTHSFSQMQILFSSPLLAIMRLGGSIWFADYNSILPTLLAIPLKLFGYTFTRYVLVNYMLFLVPVWLLLYAVMRLKVLRSSKYSALVIVLMFTFTQFYRPMLLGYVDIACLIPALLSMLLLDDYDPLNFSREQCKRDVYISSVLLCTFMFRRYFVFYVEGYIAGLAMLSLYRVMQDSSGRSKMQLLKNAVLNLAVIDVFALVIMTIFFGPMLKRILGTSYSADYAAWNAPLKQKILDIFNAYGYLPFVLAFAGVILSLVRRNMRKYACFCAVSLVITPMTFFYVQAMGVQHLYIITVQLCILQCIGVIQIVEALHSKAFRRTLLALSVMLSFAGFANCFVPSVRPLCSPAAKLFSTTYNPLVRNDIPELNRLCDHLNALTKDTDKGICVFSSSVLNGSLMQSLRKPYDLNPLPNLYRLNADDFRHGFPTALFEADILVFTEPRPKNNSVIELMTSELLEGDSSVIGRHFKADEHKFMLDHNSVVHIYVKQYDFTEDDVKYVAACMSENDPAHKDIYAKWSLKPDNSNQTFSVKWNPMVVKVFRWLLRNNIFTAEQLGAAINRSPHEVTKLVED